MPFSESKQFSRQAQDPPRTAENVKFPEKGVEHIAEAHILKEAKENDPKQAIQVFDAFCEKNWMMNVGQEKSKVLQKILKEKKPKKILELGGYCGYSAMVLASENGNSVKPDYEPVVHTIEISAEFAEIERKVTKHAGVGDRVKVHVGVVQNSKDFIVQNGPYDLIFIDHKKDVYLSDYKLLESYGVIQPGAVVIGDNIIFPGAPDYLAHFKEAENFQSVLYHQFVEYSDIPDAVLVSKKLK